MSADLSSRAASIRQRLYSYSTSISSTISSTSSPASPVHTPHLQTWAGPCWEAWDDASSQQRSFVDARQTKEGTGQQDNAPWLSGATSRTFPSLPVSLKSRVLLPADSADAESEAQGTPADALVQHPMSESGSHACCWQASDTCSPFALPKARVQLGEPHDFSHVSLIRQ